MSIVVVAGATGFVGSHLVPALRDRGHRVRGGSRHPDRAARAHPETEWVRLDVDQPETLDVALAGAEVLVYLVHHLAAGGPHLTAHEERSAAAVARAAQRGGLRRIVYLGAPEPAGPPSPHLDARLRTGRILRAGPVPCVELRATMIVGAGSESWQICRDLALRLPMMILPRWTRSRTAPVGIDDVVFALVDAVDRPIDGSVAEDLPGPEVLSARDILRRIAGRAGLRPPPGVPVPVLTPRLSSLWLKLVTRADFGIARKLVDGLEGDLLARGAPWWRRVPEHRLVPFDECVDRALREDATRTTWERMVGRIAGRGVSPRSRGSGW